MVYKKYIKRNGKTFGPYYYESYRENGKVKTRFISGPKNKDKRNWSKVIMISLVALLILGSIGYYFWNNKGITGNTIGENIISIISAKHLDSNNKLIKDIFNLVNKKDNNYAQINNEETIKIQFEKELTNKNDISFYAKSKLGGRVEVYPENGELLMTFEVKEDKLYQKFLKNLKEATSIFYLKIFGEIGFDYIFDPIPTPIKTWDADFGAADGEATAIETSLNDSVYITGRNLVDKWQTVKYNATNGSQIWAVEFNYGDDDIARGIAVDSAENIYVTGYTSVTGYYFPQTIRYNSSGTNIWNHTYGGGFRGNNFLYDVDVDNDAAYVTGVVNYSGTRDLFLIKYNASNGTILWNSTFDTGGVDDSRGVTVDNRDAVYIAGFNGSDTLIYKYNATNGSQILNITQNTNGENKFYAIAYYNDTIYAAGSSANNILMTKYNATNGSQIWSISLDHGGSNAESAYGIDVDNIGNPHISGNTSSGHYFAAKYFANGTLAWNLTENVGYARGISLDSNNDVYLTGKSGNDLHTVKFNISDLLPPDLNIIFPTNNTNHTNTNLDVNYTVSDRDGVDTCWYSNDTYLVNITLANCANITSVVWSEGLHNVTVWANDTSNQVNSSTVSFTINTTGLNIDFAKPTPLSGEVVYKFLPVNFTFTGKNITIRLYNLSMDLINTTFSSSTPAFVNYTNLSSGIYYLNATATDSANNINVSLTRNFAFVANNVTSNGTVNIDIKISDGLASFTPAGLETSDLFGTSVTSIGDLDGDGIVDLAVGAIQDENATGNEEGAIYILFMYANGSVKNDTKISKGIAGFYPTNLEADDYFGSSVTGIGDLDGDGIVDLAVGARTDENLGLGDGAVYILFMHPNGSVKNNTKIADGLSGFSPPNLDNGDEFGNAVANLGDLDGDGVTDLAVGAWSDEESATLDQGAIYILFMYPNGSVNSSTKISDGLAGFNPSNLDTNDRFGSSITNIGDLDGDGVIDLAVGAHADENSTGNAEGAVYILFMNTSGGVKNHTKIALGLVGFHPQSLDADDRFGSSVTLIGDLNRDGINDLAVGALLDENNNISGEVDVSSGGALYILFMNATGGVKNHTKIADGIAGFTPANLDASDNFGYSVTAIGDLNYDGIVDLAVGAYADENNDLENEDIDFAEGAVYILFLESNEIVTTPPASPPSSGGSGGGESSADSGSEASSESESESESGPEEKNEEVIPLIDFICEEWEKCKTNYNPNNINQPNLKLTGKQVRKCNKGNIQRLERRECSSRYAISISLVTEDRKLILQNQINGMMTTMQFISEFEDDYLIKKLNLDINI
jgi:hypothetical protein